MVSASLHFSSALFKRFSKDLSLCKKLKLEFRVLDGHSASWTNRSRLRLASIGLDDLIGVLDHLVVSGLELLELLLLGGVLMSQSIQALHVVTVLQVDHCNGRLR